MPQELNKSEEMSLYLFILLPRSICASFILTSLLEAYVYSSDKSRCARYVQDRHETSQKSDRIRNFAKSVRDRHCIIWIRYA